MQKLCLESIFVDQAMLFVKSKKYSIYEPKGSYTTPTYLNKTNIKVRHIFSMFYLPHFTY